MRRILILVFIISTVRFYAQELFFTKPAAFQNLPSIETYQVLEDRKGNIWITTDAGLCLYNGSTLKKFTVKDGIPENVILKAYEDYKGRIWFTTLSGYFFYYENNEFQTIAANDQLKKICISYTINSLFIGEKDTLYCATSGGATLLKIAPHKNYKDIIQVSGYENCNRFYFSNNLKVSEAVYGPGKIPLNSENNTYTAICNGKPLLIKYRSKSLPNTVNTRAGFDREGNAYLALGDEIVVVRYQTHKVEYYSFPSNIISFHQDAEGDLWIGTTDGGYLYKNTDLTSHPIYFLPTHTISSITVDREKSVWVTTLQSGIFKSNNKDILLLNEKGHNFQRDSSQLTIIGKKKLISVFKNGSIRTDAPFSHAEDHLGDLLSGYTDKKYSYYGTTGFVIGRKRNENKLTKIKGISALNIVKIGEDTMLSFNPKSLMIFTANKIINSIEPPFSLSFCTQLKNKTILIGARNNSGIYELKNNKLVPFLDEVPQFKTRINSIVEDAQGNLWVATNEHGLYCYDRHNKLHAFNSLISDKLNSLALDQQSNLWATTNSELIKINYSKDIHHPIIHTFNQSNGIPNQQLGKIVEFNGEIWCTTTESIFHFASDKLTLNATPPLIRIENILINDIAYKPTDINETLAYNQNNIRILSSVITNKNTSKKEFLYKLVGYDSIWHFSSVGDIQYTNLNYGVYQFIIYGLNNDKLKSAVPAKFTFIIRKPYWYTWWFLLLLLIFLYLCIHAYFIYWKNKIEKRELEKTRINEQIAEFKMTALRSQMNPHFIFNAIGSIQHYILKNDIKQSYNYLAKFSLLIRNILSNSGSEFISLSQEINTLRLYIELEQLRFTEPFKFILEIEETIDMEMDIPTMLIQPYIENSIWHGLMPKKTGGILKLILKETDNALHVTIRDNGVGRRKVSTSEKAHSRGMSITEQRIKTLEATSKKIYSTRIIDLKDNNNNPVGTEVNLIIPIY